MLGAGAALLSPKGSAICTLPNLPPVEAFSRRRSRDDVIVT